MAQSILGDCSKPVTGTLTAVGTAIGSTKFEAFERACAQAQTLLDGYVDSSTSCPAQCSEKSVDMEPDYHSAAPSYAAPPDAANLFSCTVQMSRVVTLTCAAPEAPPTGSN
jgi:hypothetical protein